MLRDRCAGAAMAKDPQAKRSLAQNRRARHDFEILEQLEAGLVLTGSEVKSLRLGRGSIQEAYGRIQRGEAFLVGMHIPEYENAGHYGHEPVHDRKLLLKKREIERLSKSVRERGKTLVPLELYFQGALVKLSLALVQGKKRHDKREVTKEREAQRDMQRAVMRRR
jgi:SsrA-binding protein